MVSKVLINAVIAEVDFGAGALPVSRRNQDKQEMQRRERENILKALGQSKGKIYGPDWGSGDPRHKAHYTRLPDEKI